MILKNQGRFPKKILSIHGWITYERTMLIGIDKTNTEALKKLTGESSVFPLDIALGVNKVPFKMTPRMALEIAREGVRAKSYREAAETLKTRFGEDFNFFVSAKAIVLAKSPNLGSGGKSRRKFLSISSSY